MVWSSDWRYEGGFEMSGCMEEIMEEGREKKEHSEEEEEEEEAIRSTLYHHLGLLQNGY